MATLSTPPRTNHAQPITIRFDDGTTDRWWFDHTHTLRAWHGRFGGAISRQVNVHRQTLRVESPGSSGGVRPVTILRNDTSEPVVITSGTDRWLIGYAFPGCIATIRQENKNPTEIASARWSAPDVPSELSIGRHHLEFVTTDDGIVRQIHGTTGTTAFATDELGLPTAITTADGNHLAIRRDLRNGTVTLTADDGSTRVIGADPLLEERAESPPAAEAAGNGVDAVAERFPGSRCHALVVAGRRIRLTRHPNGTVASAYIEGTGAVSRAGEAKTFGGLNLSFDGQVAATVDTDIHHYPKATIADPDTSRTVAVLDSANEVSVCTAFDRSPDPGRSPSEWIHSSGAIWRGETPDYRIIPPDSPTFAEETAPSGFLALCASPSLDPTVSTDATIRDWLHHITLLVATPGQFIVTSLLDILNETMR